ncbi:CRISPR-associated RAMP protein Csx7 [Clostridium sp.]|uniref:type III CRISPR-associated RAMP protein Csx7 n=1 Tax=Clostridium sp. TaxID=1506 RepID=UPI003A5C77D7
MLFDKFNNKYIVKGTMVAVTPIHIGAGNMNLDPLEVDNSVIRDSNGKPYIPGSSLKGVLRSYLEVLLKSLNIDDLTSCIIVNDPCIKDSDIKTMRNECKARMEKSKKGNFKYNYDEELSKKIYDKMCDVCKIFGSNYFASKLKIKDLYSKDDKVYVERRDGVVIDRDTGTSLNGRKYDFEQVPAGTKFDFYMTVDNLDEKHESILKIIISILENEELKVGGKTSVGLGNIKLIDKEVYKITKDNLKQYLFNGLSDEMRWSYV